MPMLRDTRRTDEWIRSNVLQNPLAELPDATGKLGTGIFSSGVVRLSYPHILRAVINKADPSKPPKFSCGIWFTPIHNLEPLYQCGARLVAGFRRLPDPRMIPINRPIPKDIAGINTPFHDQFEKAVTGAPGYTQGCMYLNASSDRPPQVRRISAGQRVDVTQEQQALVYGGMWGIVTFNLYMSAENKQANIPARLCAGLMNVLLYADDTPIGQQRMGAEEAFRNVQGGEEIGLPDSVGTQGGYVQGADELMPGQPVHGYMGQPAQQMYGNPPNWGTLPQQQGGYMQPQQPMSEEELRRRLSGY